MMMHDDRTPVVVMHDNRSSVDGPPVMDDNHCFFDRGLHRLVLKGARQDGRGGGHAGHHSEADDGGDNAISQSFKHLAFDKN